MPKKIPAKKSELAIVDPNEKIRDQVAKHRLMLLDQQRTIESVDAPEEERLKLAFGYWLLYPLWKDLFVDGPLSLTLDETIRSQIRASEQILNRTHTEAVYTLMKQADKTGGNSAAIWQSGEYCRKLLEHDPAKHNPHDRADDSWPGCLHKSIYELPADIRQSIQDGHAQVVRLGIQPPKDTSTWAMMSPGDLENLTGFSDSVVKEMLRTQQIPNVCINSKRYRVHPDFIANTKNLRK